MAKPTRAQRSAASADLDSPITVSSRLALLDGDNVRQAERIRAFAVSILALVPADLGAHPALKVDPTEPAESDAQRWELREALGAVRALADAIEDSAWRLQADMALNLTDLRADLGIAEGKHHG